MCDMPLDILYTVISVKKVNLITILVGLVYVAKINVSVRLILLHVR